MASRRVIVSVLVVVYLTCLVSTVAGVPELERGSGAASRFKLDADMLPAANFDCNKKFPEPKVPGAVPKWAKGKSTATLAKTASVKVLKSDTGKDTGAFVKDSEMVIKTCNANSLHAAIDYSAPAVKASAGSMDPEWDIYFDCGAGKTHTIQVQRTLVFGSGSVKSAGRYKLIAPDMNIELSGGKKYRIVQILKYADLLVSGITFSFGKQVNYTKNQKEVPTPGGFSGAAIQATYLSTLTAHRCKFIKNKSLSYFASKGMGAGISAETDAVVKIWGCHFERNQSSTGGAVGATNARLLYIAESTFNKNQARGGVFEGALQKGYKKPLLLVKGGAVRADSFRGYDSSDPHLVLCGCKFIENKLRFKASHLSRYGYKATDEEYLRASGAAVSTFMKNGLLKLDKGDENLIAARGCTFNNNISEIGFTSSRLGAFVFEVEGAGRQDYEGMVFKANEVEDAVVRLMTVKPPAKSALSSYSVAMRDLTFKNNGVKEIEFIPYSKEMDCAISDVSGLPDGKYDCFKSID